jgi:hypothetical protein
VFVRQLSRALKAGHTVISADESYCNERKNREFSFHPAGSPFASFARPKGAGLGGRVCFVQAIGVDSLSGVPPDLVSVVGDVKSVAPHGAFMFFAKKGASGGD